MLEEIGRRLSALGTRAARVRGLTATLSSRERAEQARRAPGDASPREPAADDYELPLDFY